MKRVIQALGLLALLAPLHALAQPATSGGALPGPLPLFPPDNWWNADVTAASVDSTATTNFHNSTGSTIVHPDFGGDVTGSFPQIYGMVYATVPGTEPLVNVAFDYADQSDTGALGRPPGYPIPVEAITQPAQPGDPHWIEGGYPGDQDQGDDQHMLIVDRDNRILFETWQTRYVGTPPSGQWQAGSGAIWYLDSNQRRPDTWTSADAAGLAILPGLVRYDEAYPANGTDPIRHAFRVTLDAVFGYVFPASHQADTGGSTDLPLGARLRLKNSYTPPGTCSECTDPGFLKMVQAMKTYGLILADTGSSIYVSGTYDTRWDNGTLNPALGTITGNDFEVLQLGWQPTSPPAAGHVKFHTIVPCRVVDTRRAPGAYGAPAIPGGGGQRSFTVVDPAGSCGVPAGSVAVSANITVINPSGKGDLRFWAADQPVPASSIINYNAGRTRANNAVLALSTSGSGALAVQNDMTDPTASANVAIDVNGYFQ